MAGNFRTVRTYVKEDFCSRTTGDAKQLIANDMGIGSGTFPSVLSIHKMGSVRQVESADRFHLDSMVMTFEYGRVHL